MKKKFQIITLIPGVPWMLGGAVLILKSFRIFLKSSEVNHNLLILIVALFVFSLIGFLKYYFIFKKTVLKQISATKDFLTHNSKKKFLKEIFEFKKLILYFSMSIFSIFLRKTIESDFLFFFLRASIGTGLFISGTVYLKKLRKTLSIYE